MRNKSVYTAILCALMFASTFSIFFVKQAFSQSTTRLYVDPPTIIDPTMTPPKTFTINLTVENVTDLYGWDIQLFYRNDLLNATGYTFGPFLESGGSTFTIAKEFNDGYNATHGLIWLADALLGAPSGVDGNGVIASITFKVTGTGSSPLSLFNTKLSDHNANSIPHEAYDGYFNNITSAATLSVDPSSIINPDLEPSTNFTIDIYIHNVISLKSWEFKLFYRNNVLNASHMEFGPFLETAGATSQSIKQLTDNYNGTHGIVWLNDTLLSGAANGSGIIASINFTVTGNGESSLSLCDTVLTDPWGYLLNHEAYDGYFNNVLMARIFVDPPEIFDPTLVPGSELNVMIKIANVTGLYSFSFNMSYNNEVLNCLGVLIIPYNNETAFNVDVAWKDSIGELHVNVTYCSPAEPITSLTAFAVARIHFQIVERGCSILDLHDTQMLDEYGTSIIHVAQDGLICVLIRDVAVTNITTDKNEVYPGGLIQVNVTAKNEGNITESFEVSLYYGDIFLTNLSVVNLPPNNETVVEFTWDTTGFSPCYNESLKAEASVVPYETDIADNTFIDGIVKIKILGDINGDGIVDIFDITIAAAAFGSSPGDPSWDERADINMDGIVDIFDLVIIATHFGQHYP